MNERGAAMKAAVVDTPRREARVGTRLLAWSALAGVVAYVGIDVLLAFLRPAYSLIYNAESDYGRGPWYWVMDANFLLRCALSLALVAALARALPRTGPRTGRQAGPEAARQDGRARAGRILLIIWAVCSGLLAFFADDLEGQPVHLSGGVHLLLAFIAFPCVAVGTILISSSLWSDPAWRSARSDRSARSARSVRSVRAVLLGVSVAGAAAFLLLGTAFGHRHAPGGLYERIFLGLELFWIALAAGGLIRTGA